MSNYLKDTIESMTQRATEMSDLYKSTHKVTWGISVLLSAMLLKWVLAGFPIYFPGAEALAPEIKMYYLTQFNIASVACGVLFAILLVWRVFHNYICLQAIERASKVKTLLNLLDSLRESFGIKEQKDPTLDDLRKEHETEDERRERLARILFSTGMPDDKKDES